MEDLIGKKIDNYSIISMLGRGGMGIVYKAHDETLDRFVAIKILNVQVVYKSRFRERFRREAKNQAQLSHPNIVTVYDFIEYRGLIGIVMEYVEGESLEKVMTRQQRLHLYDVIYILRQVLAAIGHAHSKGFVHRDIKPSNIILNREGTVKIMDFGISKSLFEKTMTKTGSQVGTVYYMSPEQIKSGDVDHTADIYSIGCTMYEMLCGRPPYSYENEYEVMDAHLKESVPKVSDSVTGLPEDVDRIIQKCLKKNPGERYSKCSEMNDSFNVLDKYLNEVGAKYFIRRKKDPRRTKLISIAWTAALIIFMSALTYFVYLQVRELLNSGTLEKFEKYSITSLFESEPEFNLKQLNTVKSGTNFSLNSIYFANDRTGIAVGDSSQISLSIDSGNTWNDVDQIGSEKYNDVYINDSGIAYIVGENSTLLVSEDLFQSSSKIELEKGYNFQRIFFADKYTGYILGSDGLILRSGDAGETWTRIITNTNEALFDLAFMDEKSGVAVGMKGELLRTDDGGISWTVQEKFTGNYLKSIDFADEDTGLIVGGNNSIFRTENGGRSWENVGIEKSGGLNHVRFLNEDIAIIVGSKGRILVTTDSGETWKLVESKIFDNLFRMNVLDNGKVFIAGIGGTIIRLQ